MTPQKVSVLPVDLHRDGRLIEEARETLLNEKHFEGRSWRSVFSQALQGILERVQV